MVHINNAALAVEKTFAKARPASLVANLLPAQKSLLGPVPNRSSLDRNSFGNVPNNQKNVSNPFVKRSPQISTQGNATDYDDRTGFIKPLLIYPSNNNNNNRQRNNKQMTGPNQNVRFKLEQPPQPDRAKFKSVVDLFCFQNAVNRLIFVSGPGTVSAATTRFDRSLFLRKLSRRSSRSGKRSVKDLFSSFCRQYIRMLF